MKGEMPNLSQSRRLKMVMALTLLVLGQQVVAPMALAQKVDGWLSWRGPLQTGVSLEKNLPDDLELDGESHKWSYPVKGGGAPVIADGRVYLFGYHEENEGTLVEETLLCLDAETGEKIWEYRSRDFLSDNIYNRYGIGSPCVDPETGNVYFMATSGLALAFDRDGNKLWERSMLEEFWRLTFPNGRTGGPVIDGDFVVFRGIVANWGETGPPGDRFYGFEKESGKLAWFSSPDVRPVDSSNSSPFFGDLDGRRVFYAGTGSGSIICSNARTGEPVWRATISQGGVNASLLLYGEDKLIAIHGKENVDSTTKGRMVCFNIPTEYPQGEKPIILTDEDEVWRNDGLVAFSSSPVLHDGKVYTTVATGSLVCVDADSGETLWEVKLGPDQLHASPLYADGKIYVPMFDGKVFVIKPHEDRGEIVSEAEMGANILAAPSVYAGKVFIQTKEALHCFSEGKGKYVGVKTPKTRVKDKTIAALQIVPAEFAITPGESVDLTVWGLNEVGQRIRKLNNATWQVQRLNGSVEAGGTFQAGLDARRGAGYLTAAVGDLEGRARGRITAGAGYSEDFEGFTLSNTNHLGESVAFPPGDWLGARVKWSVIEREGEKVVTNVLDSVIKQRTMNFVGHHDLSNYTFSADVLTDGNRRIKSSVGLVNQRYLIALVGNWRILEVTSNHDRLKVSVPFDFKANTWYRLVTKVRENGDGTGVVMAKAWPKTEAEPEEWTIEVPVDRLHPKGAPAIYALSPQAKKRVFIDNLEIVSNN